MRWDEIAFFHRVCNPIFSVFFLLYNWKKERYNGNRICKERLDCMKFIHIGDLHLACEPEKGTPLGKIREKEIWESFGHVLNRCEEEKIDFLFLSGDIFHRAPLVRELKELNYMLGKLSYTKVIMIAGNHDYLGVNSNYLGFEWSPCVTFFYTDYVDSVYFEDCNTRIYGLSFFARQWRESVLHGVKPLHGGEISILVAHGGEGDTLPMDKAELEQAGFDYVALGHIHQPQRVSEHVVYAGSLEPLDKNETGEHGYYFGEITKDRALSVEFVPAAKRRYRILNLSVTPELTNGQIADICREQVETLGEEDMYRIRLVGRRNADLQFNVELLSSVGIVIEVVDDTVPDFDFDALEKENTDNILGMFIRESKKIDRSEEERELVLEFGVEALLAQIHRK